MPIKDFIHHYPRALFNDIPRVGAHFYDIPGSGRTFTTYPGRCALLRHTRVGAQFNDITGALDMSKALDTIYIHTLMRKLLQTIIKFIANYIKGRKAYTTYRNHTSKQRQFKTGVPQGGVLSPTLFSTFTPQTYHHPVHRFRSWPMQMTSQSHPHTQVRVQPRNTYNHTYTKFLPGQNKTTSY